MNENRIERISCGKEFAIVFIENFNYFGWGRNYSGELGLGHNNDCNSPQQIVDLSVCIPFHFKIKMFILTTTKQQIEY